MNRYVVLNFFSLFMIQGSNALYPLILYPYLFIVFHSEYFSILVISESVMLYVIALSLYSFDVTGVKDVGLASSEQKRSEVFYDILLIRIVFFLAVSFFCLFMTFIFFSDYLLLIFIWLLFPLGMILQCNYYHQAVEKNIVLAVIVFFSRFSSLFISFFLVNSDEDFYLAILILGLNYFFSGIASLFFLIKSVKFSYYKFNIERLYAKLKEGASIYLGNLSVSLFRGSNILLLSLVSNTASVAVYSLAEKFIKTMQAFVRPLNQFAYPKVVQDIRENKNIDNIFKVLINRTMPQVIILVVGIVMLFFIGGGGKYYDFLPDDIEKAFFIFFMMSFSTVFGVCNYMFGTVGMSLIGFGSYYAKVVFYIGLLSIILTLYLGYYVHESGAALSYLLSELFLFLFFIFKFRVMINRYAK